MGKYLLKRVGQTLIVLFITSIISFSLIHLIPGDPVYAMLGTEITPERHDQVYEEMNLNAPLPKQYVDWITKFVRGDMGYSYVQRRQVADLLATRLPVTAYLGVLSAIFSVITGITLGIFTAVKRGKWQDNVLTVLANIGMATPTFWLGVVLVSVFSLNLKWLPSYGFTFPWVNLGKSLKQCIMPVFCMGLGSIASYTRQTRSSMLEVLRQDYIRTAKAKGLPQGVILRRHALKNALIPILTLVGMSIRNTIAGSAVVESVFNINGVGNLMVYSISARDFNTVTASIMLISAMTCLCNLLVDIAYACVDPRIRL